MYPADGDDSIVKKDRRGELFYYMHGQCIARYNVERFCNKLSKVKIMNNFREPIPEAYFPKMIRTLSQRSYPPRLTNSTLKDFNRDDFGGAKFDIADLERWRDRILEAIDMGYVLDVRKSFYLFFCRFFKLSILLGKKHSCSTNSFRRSGYFGKYC